MSEQQLHNPAKGTKPQHRRTQSVAALAWVPLEKMSWVSETAPCCWDVTQELWAVMQSSSSPGLYRDPRHPGDRAQLSHCFSWFNVLVLLLSHWDLHLDFSFFAYIQSCRTLVQVLDADASAWPYWFLWTAGEEQKGYFCPVLLSQSDSGIWSVKLSELALHLQIESFRPNSPEEGRRAETSKVWYKYVFLC